MLNVGFKPIISSSSTSFLICHIYYSGIHLSLAKLSNICLSNSFLLDLGLYNFNGRRRRHSREEERSSR